MKKEISLGKWREAELDTLVRQASAIDDTGERIDFLSRQFLGTPYKDKTLIGSATLPEVFVINLGGVDCFTFLDYVEAMRLSRTFADFPSNLQRVRYRDASVAFNRRNHFFTDWHVCNARLVQDVTPEIGKGKTEEVLKVLNLREDGSLFLPGIEPSERPIRYIPSRHIDNSLLARLRTGDYVGIYSTIDGLDVSHVGIIINDKGRVLFRHASSVTAVRKVTDQDFGEYILNKAGAIILRPNRLDKKK